MKRKRRERGRPLIEVFADSGRRRAAKRARRIEDLVQRLDAVEVLLDELLEELRELNRDK